MTGRSLSAEQRVHARRALLFLAERSAPARLAEALGLTVVALQKARAPSRVVGRRRRRAGGPDRGRRQVLVAVGGAHDLEAELDVPATSARPGAWQWNSSPIAAAMTSTAPTARGALAALAATSKKLGTGVLQRSGESPTRT